MIRASATWLCATGLLLATSACSEGTGVGKQASGLTSDVGEDAAGSEVAPDAYQVDSNSFDAAPDSALVCPGGSGCPCGTPETGNCDTGLCIEDFTAGGEKTCAKLCTDFCNNEAYLCGQTSEKDLTFVCVSRWGRLCDPCTSSSTCQVNGLSGVYCVDEGALGRFCGAPCGPGDSCPSGYGCQKVLTAEGNPATQCVRLPEEGTATYGTCPCSARAAAEHLFTDCTAPGIGPDGKPAGTCTGTRTCTTAGLGKCNAKAAAQETCNGLDDNCNGMTDEETCEDGEACTKDTCDGKGACQHENMANAGCEDGNKCTANDVCENGECKPGSAKNCDDTNPCTIDLCDPQKGCAPHTPDDGAPCTDNNPCTTGDVCEKSKCAPGVATTCAGNACQTSGCDKTTGLCLAIDVPAGTACDDGLKCTTGDACASGSCSGQPVSCNDANPCTGDACQPDSGCAHLPIAATTCSDGNACTDKDACQAGQCAGQAVTCDDKNPCTDDSCDTQTGCQHTPNTAACDDGDACTAGDACVAGACALSSAVTCMDSDVCTDDGCDKDTGCKFAANTLPCQDGNACTNGDNCSGFLCLSGAQIECGDGNLCTSDSCDPVTGCLNLPSGGAACDDGSLCTASDACQDKTCAGTKIACDDKNPCTIDSCDATKGCTTTPEAAIACDDGTKCTENDTCKSGVCFGTTVSCEDGEACTADNCLDSSGCAHTPLTDTTLECDDGDACTEKDHCDDGGCKGVTVICDDGKVCTIDSCDKSLGCLHTIAGAAACYPGPEGTQGKGECKAGTAVCDDHGDLGECKGAVVPASQEACDGKDDDCDGATDEGCAPATFRVRYGSTYLRSTSATMTARTTSGASFVAGPAKGTNKTAWFGWMAAAVGVAK